MKNIKNRKDYLYLSAIVAGFLAISLPTLNSASIWFDEAFSRYIIRFNLAEIWNFTSADVHPPLYYFFLKIWSILFGTSDFAIRSLSIFFAVCVLIVIFLFIRRIFDSKAAVISASLIAISPLFVRFSQEARMYTLMALLGVLAVWAFYEAFVAKNDAKKKTLWRKLYIIFICLGMWTQYLSALVVLAIWVIRAGLIWAKTHKKRHKFNEFFKEFFGESWLKIHLIAAAFFLPWIPFFFIQAVQVKSGFWIPSVNFTTIPNLISNQLFYLNANEINGWLSLAALTIFGGSTYLFLKNKLIISSKYYPQIKIFAAAAVLPIAILFVLSLPPFSSIFMERYLLPSIVFGTALIGIMISILHKKQKIIAFGLASLVIVTQILGLIQVNNLQGFSKTSWKVNETRQALDSARGKMRDGEPIIAENVWLFYEAVQYSNEKNKVFFINDKVNYEIGSLKMLESDDTFKIKDLDKFSKENENIWFIARPGDKKQKSMHDSWRLEEEILQEDSITGKPLYSMQKYSTKK